MAEFLVLSETDLVDIGVNEVGVRKKLLNVIADMNKREWEKSSVPKINPRHKQKGIYLSLPDAVLIIGSISRHLKFIGQNVEFVHRQIRDKPEILDIGSEVSNVQDLEQFLRETQRNLRDCEYRLSSLKGVLKCTKKGENWKKLVIAVPLISIGIYYAYKFVQKYL